MKRTLAPLTLSLLLGACAAAAPPAADVPPAPPVESAEAASLEALFEQYDAAQLALSPISKSYRGIRDQDYGRWDSFDDAQEVDRKSTRLNSSHVKISYAVFCLK